MASPGEISPSNSLLNTSSTLHSMHPEPEATSMYPALYMRPSFVGAFNHINSLVLYSNGPINVTSIYRPRQDLSIHV